MHGNKQSQKASPGTWGMIQCVKLLPLKCKDPEYGSLPPMSMLGRCNGPPVIPAWESQELLGIERSPKASWLDKLNESASSDFKQENI